jgi:hypothetical protein
MNSGQGLNTTASLSICAESFCKEVRRTGEYFSEDKEKDMNYFLIIEGHPSHYMQGNGGRNDLQEVKKLKSK